jgi:multiple sugar transport system substrate-binding protein
MNSSSTRLAFPLFFCLALVTASFTGCESEPGSKTRDGKIHLTVWYHSGQQSERETIQAQVERFNGRQDKIEVELTIIPEGTYNEQVQSAAVAGELPDFLEFDGPYLYNYVWQGLLVPLDDLLQAEVKAELLASIVEQGTYQGKLYSVGTFDSGLGLYGRRSRLEAAGARIPTGPDDAWTIEEFNKILTDLEKQDEDGRVLDLKLNYEGEWYTYAFSPPIQSAGGDLIDRSDFQSADGVLNGSGAVSAMKTIQAWIQSGRVDPNVDDAAFTSGRVPLSWSGHWDYRRYHKAHGEDLVVLPLPDFGDGSRTGQGSWSWGITKRCQHPEAAAEVLEFLLETDEVLSMANANAAVPATHSAIEASELYAREGPLHLFVEQLEGEYSIPRPRTPAYPVISSAFQDAFADIRNGADVKSTLDEAVKVIDQDIEDNLGYPSQ